MSTTIYVYTMKKGGGSWSRYLFPFDVDGFTQLGDELYIRHGTKISKVDPDAVADIIDGDSAEIVGTVQWSWLDFGRPGVTKMMESFDIVATGLPSISFGYSQKNLSSFTTAFPYNGGDSFESTPIPMFLQAPTISPKITFPYAPWKLSQLVLHLHDNEPTT